MKGSWSICLRQIARWNNIYKQHTQKRGFSILSYPIPKQVTKLVQWGHKSVNQWSFDKRSHDIKTFQWSLKKCFDILKSQTRTLLIQVFITQITSTYFRDSCLKSNGNFVVFSLIFYNILLLNNKERFKQLIGIIHSVQFSLLTHGSMKIIL